MDLFVRFNQVGVTLLIATHDRQLIQSMGSRILTLDRGHLVGDTAPLSKRSDQH